MAKQKNNKKKASEYTEVLDPVVTETGIGKAEKNALKDIKNKNNK